jgi:hypothetical protein
LWVTPLSEHGQLLTQLDIERMALRAQGPDTIERLLHYRIRPHCHVAIVSNIYSSVKREFIDCPD